jgi:hypothetical protein
MTDRCLAALRSAHEKLCIAQTDVKWPGHKQQLGEALKTIERIGVFYFADVWSEYQLPTTELDKEQTDD